MMYADAEKSFHVGARMRDGEQKKCMQYIDSLKYGACKEDICKYCTQYCVEWYTRKAIIYKHIFLFLSIYNVHNAIKRRPYGAS